MGKDLRAAKRRTVLAVDTGTGCSELPELMENLEQWKIVDSARARST